MPRASKKTTPAPRPAKSNIGLGFSSATVRHGFLISLPQGAGRDDFIGIHECRNIDLTQPSAPAGVGTDDRDPGLRVLIDRNRWNALAPAFWDEANRRLRSSGLPPARYQKTATQPIPVHPTLGKELCVLCWAVEDAPPEVIPNALLNWEALAPEERWWLYTMTVATTSQAVKHRGVGWRKALRAALAEAPFVKGEGLAQKTRRNLLEPAQKTLDFD
ncbi:MAG: DUF3780 domain-containing protein [Planctomycetaceae bacterium]|jgi:hypothetical protein